MDQELRNHPEQRGMWMQWLSALSFGSWGRGHRQEENRRQTKLIRHLYFVLQSQTETLDEVNGKLDLLAQETVASRHNTENAVKDKNTHRIKEEDLLRWLDELHKLSKGVPTESLSARIINNLAADLYTIGNIEPIAQIGKMADPINCRIVDTQAIDGQSSGTITDVVEQGYCRRDGTRAREAVVVVSSAASQQPEQEEVQHETSCLRD